MRVSGSSAVEKAPRPVGNRTKSDSSSAKSRKLKRLT